MSKAKIYQQNAQQLNIDQMVSQHSQLVKQIARHIHNRLPSSVQLDDLVQAGMIGLIEAVQRYDANKMASFETYASIRIRGTIIDELRRSSWMPRSVHHNMRQIASAIHELEKRHHREAQSSEIAAELGVDMDQYAEMLTASYANELFSINELEGDSISGDQAHEEPFNEFEKTEAKNRLAKLVSILPKQEQYVLAFYYSEKLKFKEIGEVLGIGEARVCQLHSQAIARLQARLMRD